MALEDEGTTETQPDEGLTEEQPDWLLPRFKSVEEQARSYSEAERRMTEVGADRNRLQQERDTLAEQLEEARSAPAQQQQQQYGQDDLAYNPLVIRLQQAKMEGNVIEELRVMAEISQAAAHQAAQANQPQPVEAQQDLSVLATVAEQQARADNPDYDEYEGRAMEILQENQHLFPNRTTLQGVLAGTNAALNIARGEAASRDRQTLAAKQQQAEADRQRKLSAQTVEGGGQKTPAPDEQSALWDQIKNAGTGAFRLPR